jgi:hypothetical protein
MAWTAPSCEALSLAPVVRWMSAANQNEVQPRADPADSTPRHDKAKFDVWLYRAGQMLALALVAPEIALWGARPQAISALLVFWGAAELASQLRGRKS